MYLNEFDMILSGVILFLSIKGFFNGINREIFSFIGFIVGIFIATRFNMEAGNFISEQVFHINKEETIRLLGFISIFLSMLLGSAIVSNIFSMSLSPMHIFSKLLGYILSVIKYIIIFSMIIVGIEHSDFLNKKLKKYYEHSKIILYSKDAGLIILNMKKINMNKSSSTFNNLDKNIDENLTKEI